MIRMIIIILIIWCLVDVRVCTKAPLQPQSARTSHYTLKSGALLAIFEVGFNMNLMGRRWLRMSPFFDFGDFWGSVFVISCRFCIIFDTFWPWKMNIHIRKINFASTINSGTLFLTQNSDFYFCSPKSPETTHQKVNVHKQQSGVNKGVICFRRADSIFLFLQIFELFRLSKHPKHITVE